MSEEKPRSEEQFRLDQMPDEELRALARGIMLDVPANANRDDLAERIRRQLRLIDRLDRQVLLDLIVRARRPVARSATNVELVREIAHAEIRHYEGLALPALAALAELRGLIVPDTVTDDQLRAMLMKLDGWGGWFARKRRALVAMALGKLLDDGREYQFLPDRPADTSIRRQIEQQGVVGGIASRLRTVADDYINAKLDEIETRIDRKLDEIDQRLAEWRDQEIANRLKIVKITLVASIIIAVVSLVYSFIRVRF